MRVKKYSQSKVEVRPPLNGAHVNPMLLGTFPKKLRVVNALGTAHDFLATHHKVVGVGVPGRNTTERTDNT